MPRFFKIQDLMINVMPDQGQRIAGVCDLSFCAYPTRCMGVSFLQCGKVTCMNYSSLGDACPGGSCYDWSRTECTYTECNQCVTKAGPPYTQQCAPGTGQKSVDQQLGDLSGLKVQLREALAQVELQERVLEESLRPQTLEEINQLESRLTAALEDLQTQRAHLEREQDAGQSGS